MEHISKTLARVNRNQHDSQIRQKPFTDEHHAHLTRLWLALDSAFGRKFDDGGGIDSPKFMEWMDGTRGITPPQMVAGTAKAKVFNGGGWPPTLGEFRVLCNPSLDTSRVQTYSNRDFTQERLESDRKALDAPVAGRKTTTTRAAQKHFAACRELFKGETNERITTKSN